MRGKGKVSSKRPVARTALISMAAIEVAGETLDASGAMRKAPNAGKNPYIRKIEAVQREGIHHFSGGERDFRDEKDLRFEEKSREINNTLPGQRYERDFERKKPHGQRNGFPWQRESLGGKRGSFAESPRRGEQPGRKAPRSRPPRQLLGGDAPGPKFAAALLPSGHNAPRASARLDSTLAVARLTCTARQHPPRERPTPWAT